MKFYKIGWIQKSNFKDLRLPEMKSNIVLLMSILVFCLFCVRQLWCLLIFFVFFMLLIRNI